MSKPRVVFDHVWKKFRIGERHDSLRDLVPSTMRRMFGRVDATELQEQEFWAVKDVSFEVHEGRALGIIGPNGAGKSTTLKLLTRILRPTRGTMAVHGRVGALIEIAAGFHPDLTGRENVFLQGTIMGMSRDEIRSRLDAIVDFAGVSRFIDTPVKRYSSGMNARLGFSIAAHLSPEVLIIDEVLSVGDVVFQTRCVERMMEFKRQGVAIVFVSHNLQAVSGLCDEALFLKGETLAYGPTSGVLHKYLEASLAKAHEDTGAEIHIQDARLTDEQGRAVSVAHPGMALVLHLSCLVREPVRDVDLSFVCHRSTDMLAVYDGNFHDHEVGFSGQAAGSVMDIEVRFRANLTRGQYHLGCEIMHNPTQRFIARLSPAAILTVEESRTYEGVADLAAQVVPSAQEPVAQS